MLSISVDYPLCVNWPSPRARARVCVYIYMEKASLQQFLRWPCVDVSLLSVCLLVSVQHLKPLTSSLLYRPGHWAGCRLCTRRVFPSNCDRKVPLREFSIFRPGDVSSFLSSFCHYLSSFIPFFLFHFRPVLLSCRPEHVGLSLL
jgi:hypothetical protein